MKLSTLIDKFRGNRQQRAQTELDRKAREIALAAPDGSLDAASVEDLNGLLDASGRDTSYLESQVSLAQKRERVRADLAGSEERIRGLQSAKDRAQAEYEKAEKEMLRARGDAFDAHTAHERERDLVADLRKWIVDSAPEAEAAALADVHSRRSKHFQAMMASRRTAEASKDWPKLKGNQTLELDQKTKTRQYVDHGEQRKVIHEKAVAAMNAAQAAYESLAGEYSAALAAAIAA